MALSINVCADADVPEKGDSSSAALKPFKLAARACILEYFESDDVADLLAFSRERTEPGMQHILVKQVQSLFSMVLWTCSKAPGVAR